MSNKQRKRTPARKAVEVAKATSQASAGRTRLREQGTIALSKVQMDSERMKVRETRWPELICTVEAMKQDATVSTGLDLLYTFVEKAFKDFKVIPGDSKSQASKDAAAFIDYCLRNMEDQTLRQFARDAATFNEYGLSVVEKIYHKATEGKYAGKYKIKNLGFRPQASLSKTNPLVYNEDGSAIIGVKQSLTAFQNYTNTDLGYIGAIPNMSKGSDVTILLNRLMIMTTGGSTSQALGVSPLVGCYRAWREKTLIENLEVIGATKDMGGVIELKIPTSILQKANIDPNGPEAEMVNGLMEDAANAHAGDQSFFIIPSDTKDNAPMYSMTLKGIDGNGKQYSTAQLISDRKKSILDRLGAGFVNVGNDKAGSFNLSESKQTIHTEFVRRVNEIILEALNENLIPQILSLNGMALDTEDLPKVKPGLIVDVNMEEFSKAIQRVGAVGYLPKTPAVINKVLEVLGIDEEVPEDISMEELLKMLGQDVSRSGDGFAPGSSGNGTSKISSVRDNSTSNLDN